MSLAPSFRWIIGQALEKSGLTKGYSYLNQVSNLNQTSKVSNNKIDLLLQKDLINYQRLRREKPWALEILEQNPKKAKEVATNLMRHMSWPNCGLHREKIWMLVFYHLTEQQEWETLKNVFTHFKTNYYEFTGQVVLRSVWADMSQTLPMKSLLKTAELSNILYEGETTQSLWMAKQMECFFTSVLNYTDTNLKEAKKLAEEYKNYWTHIESWKDCSLMIVSVLNEHRPQSELTLVQKILCSGLVDAMKENPESQDKNIPTELLFSPLFSSKIEELKTKKIKHINMAQYVGMDPVLSLCIPEMLLKEQLSSHLPLNDNPSSRSIRSKRI